MANGAIIGGTTFSNYRTWASLRTVFARFTGFGFPLYSPYSRNYEANLSNFSTSFMSVSPGSGLIRADRYAKDNGPYLESQNFAVDQYENTVALNWFEDTPEDPEEVPSTLVPEEVQNELIGETAVFQDGVTTITLTSALFSPPYGKQTYTPSGTGSSGQIASIGKLTPIT